MLLQSLETESDIRQTNPAETYSGGKRNSAKRNMRIPPVVETLRDFFFPYMGISSVKSQASSASFGTHPISFPKTRQYSPSFSGTKFR